METCEGTGKHLRPVHFNTGNRKPHPWICIACGKVLVGQVSDKEKEAFILFAKSFERETQPTTERKETMSDIKTKTKKKSSFKLPEKLAGVKVTTPKFILSFPTLYTPRKYKDDDNAKATYSIQMLFGKKQNLDVLKKAMHQAQVEAFGKDKAKWPEIELPWRDGDHSDYEGYAGKYSLGAKTYNRPTVVDENKQPALENEVYPGIEARASLVVKVAESGGKFYVTCYLQGIQVILGSGTKIGGGCNVDEDFGDDEEFSSSGSSDDGEESSDDGDDATDDDNDDMGF